MIGNAANVSRLAVTLAVGGKRGLHARQRRVDQFQRLEHVDFPGEEQVDFRRAAAGDGLHAVEALDAC